MKNIKKILSYILVGLLVFFIPWPFILLGWSKIKEIATATILLAWLVIGVITNRPKTFFRVGLVSAIFFWLTQEGLISILPAELGELGLKTPTISAISSLFGILLPKVMAIVEGFLSSKEEEDQEDQAN